MKVAVYLMRILRSGEKQLRIGVDHLASQFGKFRHAIGRMGKKCIDRVKKLTARAGEYRDAIGYYAVLAVVLVALSAAAYDYRGKKAERAVLDSNSAPESGIAVQLQTDPTLSPEEADPAFVLPVRGKLIGEFADNELVWSTTLQLWQTHPAIDIAASAGEAVVAAADGTVIEAYSDALYGNTIAIDHGDGQIVRYASLNTLEMVEVGRKVRQGEVVGSVGTCTAESELGAHIHLEYIVNQNQADFTLLLSESDAENLQD